MHTCKVNNKKYIGQTCQTLQDRSGKNGVGYLRKNDKGEFSQPLFAKAIEKYGWDNFSHDILADNLTQEEADNLEQYYITLYNTCNTEFGYNIMSGGEHPVYNNIQHPNKGRKFSEEHKQKLSQSSKNKHKSPETEFKKGQIPWNIGQKNVARFL